MSGMVWPILILALGLILAMAEVFIPSGGILAVLSVGCIVWSIVLAFQKNNLGSALTFLLVVLVVLPIVVGVAFYYWPRSPFGKYFFLTGPSADEIDSRTPQQHSLQGLRGQVGRTLTPLRPAGVSEFEGRRVDTVTEGVMIDAGELVRVIEVRGNRVVVRRVEEGQSLGLAETTG